MDLAPAVRAWIGMAAPNGAFEHANQHEVACTTLATVPETAPSRLATKSVQIPDPM